MKNKFVEIPLRNRFFLVALLCGTLPMILFSIISYTISKKTILDNAMTDLYNVVKKNNEIIEIQLERVEEASLMFTVDETLMEVLNDEQPVKRSQLLHRNLEIKRVMDRYFLGIPGIYSYHLCTDRFLMAGNYPDATIPNYKPSMYVPYEEFLDSGLYACGAEAKGRLIWYPTYNYEEMYGLKEYRNIHYKYRYLFSAVKQINCLMGKEDGRFNPVLIVSYTPDFFENIIKSSELGAMTEAVSYIIDEQGNLIYCQEEDELTRPLTAIFDSSKPPSAGSGDVNHNRLDTSGSGYGRIELEGTEYILAYDTQSLTGWKQLVLVPSRAFIGSMNKVPQTLLLLTLASSFLLILLLNFISGNMTRSLQVVIEGMKRMGAGEFMLRLPEPRDREARILVRKFNDMGERIHGLIVENYEIKLREKEAQIMALNLQMNPHFLYNTLNTINMMAIECGQPDISRALVSLAQMLQRTLRMKGDGCSVREELENLQDYLYIMGLRLEGAFTTHVDIQKEMLDTKVPYFMLQPLVENSITHGFEGTEEGGVLRIRGFLGPDGKREFQITDNGRGFSVWEGRGEGDREGKREDYREGYREDHREGLGIGNLKNRLYLMYGEGYSMEIRSESMLGTIVEIILPPESTVDEPSQ